MHEARRSVHWESWLLRLVLVGIVVGQVLEHNRAGATTAIEGLVVTLLPVLVQRLSKTHVPRALELAWVFGMVLQFGSESTKLFEVVYYWDKIVHPTLVALCALVAGWLLLGYRDAYHKRIPTHLVALFGWLVGACIGAFWEFVEFTGDWFANTGLQKSNGDTMTDLLANDIGALVATLVGFWIYFYLLGPRQREQMGRVAGWLAHGPSVLLARHGRVVGAAFALGVVALIGAGVWIDRNPPALAAGLAQGRGQQWTFAPANPAAANVQVLEGAWQSDPQAGLCHVNLGEDGKPPTPGSEKEALLNLTPGADYGASGQRFSVQTSYVEVRPPEKDGTQMTGGIAFGLRDTKDYYVLEENALHDILRVDQYIHGKRRDVREQEYRTHANEWHTLQLSVGGGHVAAGIDGQTLYSVDGLANTDGPIGLWGIASDATCFSGVSVQTSDSSAIHAPVPMVFQEPL